MTLSLKQSLKYASFTILTLSQIAHAQPGMSDQQLQQMMKQAEEAQKCFSKIDQSKFDELEAKGTKMEAEIKSLCAAGKRDEAMSSAIKFSKQMHNDPQLKALRECSELMQGAMAGMPQPYLPPEMDDEDEGGHVCDDM
jgi:NaMN:DMB phosphoribosyltransferase